MCEQLDAFYDVVFEVGPGVIKANSAVLSSRSSYFKSLLSGYFKENHRVVINGIPKEYFVQIIRYLYIDDFHPKECNLEYFLDLLVYTDYMMLTRMTQKVC